jgi:predicted nucleic acid-binding protein
MDLISIDETILREAARLRAIKTGLRTPDAIHAATALLNPPDMFLTNDPDFRKVPGLPVTLLSDLLTP